MSFNLSVKNSTINNLLQSFLILAIPFITTSCANPVYKGCMYEGERLNDLPHGRGVIACPHGQTVYSNPGDYQGEWKEGKRNGKGKIWVRDTFSPEKITGEYNVDCKDDQCWDTASGIQIPTAYEY